MDELDLLVLQKILVGALKRGRPKKTDKVSFLQWEKDARWIVHELYSNGYLPIRVCASEIFLKELGLNE